MSDNVKVKMSDKSKGPHISELPFTWQNWHQHVNWLNTYFVIFVPLAGLTAAYWTPLRLNTALFSVFYYAITGIGITAGKKFDLVTSMPWSGATLNLGQDTTASGRTHATRHRHLSRST